MLNIGKIEEGHFYLKTAINAMEKHALREKEEIEKKFNKNPSIQKKDLEEIKLDKRKDLELTKIDFLNKRLNDYIKRIRKNFPDPAELDNIYQELIDTSEIPTKEVREERRNLLKIAHLIDEKTLNTETKIKRAKTRQTISFIVNKHFKKLNKVFERFEETFTKLDTARKFIKSLPKFENIFTVAIAGFPNVGKSTLMQNLTGSPVEIQKYPFTTKGLMFSYINYHDSRAIQLIDTPGLLQREKKNNIEKRASLVLTQFSNVIVFVIDFTTSCGYTIQEQMNLLEEITDIGKKTIIYKSKSDLFSQETYEKEKEWEETLSNYSVYDNSAQLRDVLIEEYLNSEEKLDPRNLKVIK